jgi:YHS domain-containing protein
MRIAVLCFAVAFGTGYDKAVCPVDKKTFDVKEDTLKVGVNAGAVHFCNETCLKAFAKEPEKFLDKNVVGTCVIMKRKSAKVNSKYRFVVNNALVYVCCNECLDNFPKSPWKYCGQLVDPVDKKAFQPAEDSPSSKVGAQTYYFSSKENKAAFDKEQAKYVVAFGAK